ncbi:MAG: Mur ligase family protein [bacterium]|nr:Mur ligase family protein [bacterium]
MWRMVYGMPDKAMYIYGVTGTNGKTTTSYLLASILEQAHGKEKVGMLTTVAFRVAGEEEINETKMTTLPSKKIFSYLKKMQQKGVTHVVLETTSHALDQNRFAGILFDGAIILNIAREHLDYHKTMEQYAAAKEKIVKFLKKDAPLVGKQDDEYVRKIMDRAEKNSVRVVRMTQEIIAGTNTPLAGSINKENAAAASMLARAVEISEEYISTGIEAVKLVPGRMERLTHHLRSESYSGQASNESFDIIIDYAVTPDALERLYSDLKKDINTKRILATLSAAGLRDRGKRPEMAKVVAKYADKIVVTQEDPWTESEEQIYSDLEKGLPLPLFKGELEGVGEKRIVVQWQRIPDRREAISNLLHDAKPGDVVVCTGKGAERGMGIGKDIIPWNEREIVEEILRSL